MKITTGIKIITIITAKYITRAEYGLEYRALKISPQVFIKIIAAVVITLLFGFCKYNVLTNKKQYPLSKMR